jgi:sec-independent protein translocase protein TatA
MLPIMPKPSFGFAAKVPLPAPDQHIRRFPVTFAGSKIATLARARVRAQATREQGRGWYSARTVAARLGRREAKRSHPMMPSWQELLFILLIVLVLFGARRLPEICRSLGDGLREFKDGMANATNATPPAAERVAAAVPVESTDAAAGDAAERK